MNDLDKTDQQITLKDVHSVLRIMSSDISGIKTRLDKINGSVEENTTRSLNNNKELGELKVSLKWMKEFFDRGERRDAKTEDRIWDIIKQNAPTAGVLASVIALIGVIIKLIEVINAINGM